MNPKKIEEAEFESGDVIFVYQFFDDGSIRLKEKDLTITKTFTLKDEYKIFKRDLMHICGCKDFDPKTEEFKKSFNKIEERSSIYKKLKERNLLRVLKPLYSTTLD